MTFLSAKYTLKK